MKSYPSLLPHLKRSVLSEDVQRQLLAFSDVLATKQVQDAAVQAVVTALADLPVECAVAVAGEIRSLALPGYILDADGRTARMPDYRNLLTRHPGLAMVYLFHGDGYMREAGLRTLRGAALTPFWIAAIILRLNDWVPEVRTAAMNCVLSILPETHARMLVDVAAGLLPRVRQWKRGPEELAVLDDLISAPGVFDGLMTRLAVSYDKAPHRILTAILKYPELDSYLPNLMTVAANPTVRAMAAGTLIAGKARWPIGTQIEWIDKSMGRQRSVSRFETRQVELAVSQGDLIERAARDRSSQVRKVAMQALIDAPDAWRERQPLIEMLAQDRSGAIRAGIDYILRQQAKSR